MARKGKTFGEWLDITLSNNNIMGRTLAEKVGVHDSAVSRWRAGNGVPSIEICMKIAEVLDVDALRLAVTAGHIPPQVGRVDPLPVPPPTERRESVRRQLKRIRGLTEHDRVRLLEKYEELIQEDEG